LVSQTLSLSPLCSQLAAILMSLRQLHLQVSSSHTTALLVHFSLASCPDILFATIYLTSSLSSVILSGWSRSRVPASVTFLLAPHLNTHFPGGSVTKTEDMLTHTLTEGIQDDAYGLTDIAVPHFELGQDLSLRGRSSLYKGSFLL